MKKMKNTIPGFISVVLALAGTQVAKADLVSNGGFESSSYFAGWTIAGNTAVPGNGAAEQIDQTFAHSGNQSAKLGPHTSFGEASLSEILNTVPGGKYILTFWLAIDAVNTVDYRFRAAWNNDTTNYVFDSTIYQTNINPSCMNPCPASAPRDWEKRTYMLTASSAKTPLTFSFYDNNGFIHLDDVSVNPVVPEPASAGLFAIAGLALIGGLRWVKKGRSAPAENHLLRLKADLSFFRPLPELSA